MKRKILFDRLIIALIIVLLPSVYCLGGNGPHKGAGNNKNMPAFRGNFGRVCDQTFDDAIDAVAMGHYVIHSRGSKEFSGPKEQTLAERIRNGEVAVGGVPLISGLNTNELTPDIMDALLSRAYQKGHHGQTSIKKGKRSYEVPRRHRRPTKLRRPFS